MIDEIKIPKNSPKHITASLCFGQLFLSRDIIHLVHLNTKSYSEHIVLKEYYTTLLSLTDELVEVYQGTKNERTNIQIPRSEYCEPIQHLTSLRQYIQSHRHSVFPDTHLQSIVDEIISLIDKTTYLLTLT